jgi:hypothetical protein
MCCAKAARVDCRRCQGHDEGPLGSGALADLGSHLVDMSEQLCGQIVKIDGAALPMLIKDRPVPLGAALGHARSGQR